MCRWVWNRLCEESQHRHRANLAFLAAARAAGDEDLARDDPLTFGYAEQDRHLTFWRRTVTDHETGEHWLAQGSSVAQQQTVRDFAAARTKALKDRAAKIPATQRRGLPTFKSRDRDLPTLNYTRRGFSLKLDPQTGVLRLALPGGISAPVVWSRDLPSDPKTVRVYQDSLGHWYASFVVHIEVEALPATPDAEPLGIDWGVSETATTTDDAYDLPYSGHARKAAARLARYQRMMARRKPERGQLASKGYRKARRQAAEAHKKVARQRQDTGRKWANHVVRDHDRIAVEDFKPKFLAKTTMARKAADARIAATKIELEWMATKHGRDLRLVSPRHTTMDCSNPSCGARTKHRLLLSERTYACEACGLVLPRDKNSAAVMVARAGFVPADVEGVRLPNPDVGDEAA